MKPDVETLKITDQEFEMFAGITGLREDVEHIIQLYQVYARSPDMFDRLPIEHLAIRPSTLENQDLQLHIRQTLHRKSLLHTGWLEKGIDDLLKTSLAKITKYFKALKPTQLGTLLDEVDRYNRVIEEIGFIDQLEGVGNAVMIQNRQAVVERLQQIRAELVRAVKTERLFRENPQFTMQDFALDLFSWQRIELDEQAQKYEQFVNAALEIGVRVCEEMQMWYSQRK